MAEKAVKDKDGKVIGVKVTGKDVKRLHEEMEQEAKRHDNFPCEDCDPPGMRTFKVQENGKWKCLTCGTEVGELDRSLAKGCEWFEREKGYQEATDKAFGKVEV